MCSFPFLVPRIIAIHSQLSSLPPSTPRQQCNHHHRQYKTTDLLKLIWPFGPVRTVIPEVPVEPAVLGAGEALEEAAGAESW